MSTTFQTYDVSLRANGAERLPVHGNYFLIFTATGRVDVRGPFGLLNDLGVGQGQKRAKFKELILQDASGAPNKVTIIVGNSDDDAEFINLQTIIASSSAIGLDKPTLNEFKLPLLANFTPVFNQPGEIGNKGSVVSITPQQNTNGLIVLQAFASDYSDSGYIFDAITLVYEREESKPPNLSGAALMSCTAISVSGNSVCYRGQVDTPQYVPPGNGLYWKCDGTTTSREQHWYRARFL